jgi:MoaA/NifB/PqqE/SkfB family radical SAM enzyme
MENSLTEKESSLKRTADLFGDHVIERELLDGSLPGAEVFMRELSAPVTVAWNVTETCNLQCLHCFNNSGKGKQGELSHEEAMRVVDEIKEMQVFNVCLCGGEPLLRNDLFTIIESLSEDNILVSMVSNGFLLDRTTAKELASAGVRFLQISIDGVKAETHERLRRKKGSFLRAVNAARFAADVGMELAVAFCPTKFNVSEFPEYVDMAYDLGAKMVRMMPLLRLGRTIKNKDDLIPSGDQMNKFIWSVREKGFEYIDRGLSVEWGDPLEHLYLFPYNEAKLFILELHANGDVGISAYLPLYFGNIREHTLEEFWEAGLKDAWRHPKVVEFAKKIVDLEDLQIQEPIPWEERGIHIDLFDV